MVPKMSALGGAFGLLYLNGQSSTHCCHRSECGHRRLRIPADENLAAKGLYRLAPLNEIVILAAFLQFTLRVSRKTDLIAVHPLR